MGVGVMIHSVECATRPPLVPVIGIGEHLLPEAVVEERFSCLRSNSRVPLRTARAIWNNDRVASCNQPHFWLVIHDGDSLARCSRLWRATVVGAAARFSAAVQVWNSSVAHARLSFTLPVLRLYSTHSTDGFRRMRVMK